MDPGTPVEEALAKGVATEDQFYHDMADRAAGAAAKALLPSDEQVAQRQLELLQVTTAQRIIAMVQVEVLKVDHGDRRPFAGRLRRKARAGKEVAHGHEAGGGAPGPPPVGAAGGAAFPGAPGWPFLVH